jgi:hypothetical protein
MNIESTLNIKITLKVEITLNLRLGNGGICIGRGWSLVDPPLVIYE